MPQFLRAVRTLCLLYTSYMEGVSASSPAPPVSASNNPSSVPASPSFLPSTSSPNPSHQSSPGSIRRTGSFGSILDTSSPSSIPRAARAHSMLRFGHRRSRSGNQHQPEPASPSPVLVKEAATGAEARKKSIGDPFAELETVWSSLECWFDLVKVEVEKLQKEQQQQSGSQVRIISFLYVLITISIPIYLSTMKCSKYSHTF